MDNSPRTCPPLLYQDQCRSHRDNNNKSSNSQTAVVVVE
jgi:hypothetical protein